MFGLPDWLVGLLVAVIALYVLIRASEWASESAHDKEIAKYRKRRFPNESLPYDSEVRYPPSPSRSQCLTILPPPSEGQQVWLGLDKQ